MKGERFIIVEDSIKSLDSFIHLLDQVGEWLWNKGVKQWKPGFHHQNRVTIKYRVENGCLILAYRQKILAGGCVLTEVAPSVWSNSLDEAMYISSLNVARFAAGKGLGSQIIDYCGKVTQRKGKSLLRLDCWDGNDFLKSYYQNEGFKMLDAVRVNDYFCRLFEKEVTRLSVENVRQHSNRLSKRK